MQVLLRQLLRLLLAATCVLTKHNRYHTMRPLCVLTLAHLII